MKIHGTVLKEQGVTFAIAIVKQHVLNCNETARETIRSFQSIFGSMPIILMAQDSSGRATWFGRTDIVNFLKNVPVSRIPWKEYTVS